MSYLNTANSGADALQPSRSNTKPGNVAAGDIVIFYLGRWNESGNFPAMVSIPANAVLLETLAVGQLQLLVYAKYVEGGETTYTFNWGTGRWSRLWSTYFGNRAQGLTLSALAKQAATGSGTSITSRSVTATAGDDLAWGVDTHEYSGGETHTPPASFTEVVDNEAGSACYRANVSAGSQTASGATISAGQNFAVSLIAIPEAGGGGGSDVSATMVANLPAVTATAAGLRAGSGSGAASLPAPAGTASGVRSTDATASASLPAVTATAAGLREGHGSGASTLPGVVAAAVATVNVPASATAALPPVTATAAGLREGHASGAAVLPAVAGHLFGSGSDPIASAVLPGPVGLMTGTRETFGEATAALPGPVATASGLRDGHGSGAATLPTVTAIMAGLRATTGSGSATLSQIVATIDVGSNGGEEPSPPEEDDALTLGDLMDARATHESVMLDTISIRHPGMTEGAFDPGLGYAPAVPREPYYTGKAIVQARQVQGGEISPAGVGTLVQLGYAVKIPVSVIEIAPDDIVTVHESMEPAHNGIEIVIRNVESNTLVTARRTTGLRYEPGTP